jgi:hypothetical protein
VIVMAERLADGRRIDGGLLAHGASLHEGREGRQRGPAPARIGKRLGGGRSPIKAKVRIWPDREQ